MINLDLNTAINILSLDEYSGISYKEKENMIEVEGIQENEIFDYVKEKYIGIKISYIEDRLKALYQFHIKVKGKVEELIPCLCCNYKTILERGNYQICKVCFWEDDGSSDESKYSNVNHMTLKEAKDNFKIKGVVLEKFLKFVDSEGQLKYYKDDFLE